MVRARKKKPNTKIYHHFAAVTVGATLLLALFADGEQRQKLEQVAVQNAAPHGDRLAQTTIKRRSPPKPSSQYGSGGFGSGGGNYGAPMDIAGSQGDSSSYIPADGTVAGSIPDGIEQSYGVSQEDLASLSDYERKNLLKRMRLARYGTSKAERDRQIAKLREASRIRSGSKAPSDD